MSRSRSATGERILREARAAGDTELAEAVRNWERLSRAAQAELVREIVRTRGPEIHRAYRDVVGIGHGHRRRRPRAGASPEWIAEPAVVVMVRRKRRRMGNHRRSSDEVPAALLGYAASARSRSRVLCAVPTDIESATDYRLRPHSKRIAATGGGRRNAGVLCAEVRVDGEDGALAMTCFHVACIPQASRPPGAPVPNPSIAIDESGASVGTLSRFRGHLRPGMPSFDAALVKLTSHDDEDVLAAIGYDRPSQAIDDPNKASGLAWIRTPRGPVRSIVRRTWSSFSGIDYYPGYPAPSSADLIELEVVDDRLSPRPGDSGSSVVSFNGSTLVGMYLGGGPMPGNARAAMVLPANRLLRASNYSGHATGYLSLVPA